MALFSVVKNTLQKLFKDAVHCQVCFERGWVSHSLIDIAQPAPIGPGYYSAQPRILIVLPYSGSGGGERVAKTELLGLLKGYKNGKDTIDEVFQNQARDIDSWGRRRFAEFYLRGLQLHLQTIALANVAWCASAGNSHPAEMLAECFRRHTSVLVRLLKPHVVILSGSAVHRYREDVERLLPTSRIVTTLNYAHREGYAAESEELARVRRLIADYSPQ